MKDYLHAIPHLLPAALAPLQTGLMRLKLAALFLLKSPFQVYPRALEPVTCLKGKDLIIATLCYGDGIEPFE